MKLTLSVHSSAHAARVRVVGDLDYGTAGLLVDTVSELLRDNGTLRDLHLDFTELAFCDSAGLSSLVRIHQRASAAGMHLHLDHRTPQLDRVLNITGLLEFLTTRPSEQESAESGASGASGESDIG